MKNYKNFIYFQNGSLGDFLMTIFFLENIHLNNPQLNLSVIVPKNKRFLQGFLSEYPYIKIILVNKRTWRGLGGVIQLFCFYFSSNLVLTAPTPGSLPVFVKWIAKMITLSPDSKLVGFRDRGSFNFLYDKLLTYHTNLLYPDFLLSVIEKLGFKIKKEIPTFRFVQDDRILRKNNLEKNKYVVINPSAATQGRSLDKKELNYILGRVKKDTNLRIVLIGTFGDKFLKTFRKNLVLVDLDAQTLSNLIANCRLFIGMDTGTTHLVSFLSKKSLVLAKNGTPNWLPYYNENATILYSIDGCSHQIYEGRKHLENCRGERLRCLEEVPLEIIKKKLADLLR